MDVGALLLASLSAEKDNLSFFSYKLDDRFFFGEESKVFDFIKDHVAKHHVLPNLNTLQIKFPQLPKPVEPASYYLERVQNRYEYRKLDKALTDCTDLMKLQDVWTAQNLLLEALAEIRGSHARGAVTNFKAEGADVVLKELLRVKKEAYYGLLCGWPTLDKSMLGLRPGDILSLVGRIAAGKTFLLLWIALFIFMMQKKRVLVISMEMNSLSITQRLAAIYSKTPISRIRSGAISKPETLTLAKKLNAVKLEEGELWVVDGNLNATVDDVFMLSYHLRPDVIMIDGAYLLKSPDKRLDKFRRVEANIEDMKNRCSRVGIPMVLSYQFNREAAKKQKKKGSDKGGLEDIAHSDAIGQISSIILGMFQEESTETLIRREVQVLKGRNGETGKFSINWLFEPLMDMSEILPETKQDPKEMAYL